MRHSELEHLLYGFVAGELTERERSQVESHLRSCRSCNQTVTEIQELMIAVPRSAALPGEEKDETFWAGLTTDVIQKVERREHWGSGLVRRGLDQVRIAFALHPRAPYAIAGACTAFLVTFAILSFQATTSIERTDDDRMFSSAAFQYKENQHRISEYFRASRTLLVGIANMDTPPEEDLDLLSEKATARQLVHEARLMKAQPLNRRTERLLDDLERILVELANLEENTDLPNVELVRSGIRQQNLLFKIRMAEAAFDTNDSYRQSIH